MVKKRKEPEKPQSTHACAVEACPEPGEFRAPLSRFDIGQYQYLCLKHIREFNLAWDYFDGWSRNEIESFMHDAAFGHRPTWKIGTRTVFTNDKLRDAFFRMLGEEAPHVAPKPQVRVSRKEREAFATLDLEPGTELAQIKSQYKKLVKKHHPDVNKGDKLSEETFKQITASYTYLISIYGKRDEE